MHSFRDLKVWNKAMSIVEETYAISRSLPADEKFNFISQITRSALSIPSNIAEGSGRQTNKEFCRFLDIVIGSSFELEIQLILVQRIFDVKTDDLIEQVKEVQRMTNALKRSKL
jgi:four helix bundle protein